MTLICTDCGAVRTAEERHYYFTRCDECEKEWSARIDEWRRGGEDQEFDKMFSVPKDTRH